MSRPSDARSGYGADSITLLEGLDVVRKRPGMYIGATNARGLHHMIWEVVDNAVDEAMAGFATQIDVRLLPHGGVEVSDDGRGIPVETHELGIPTVDVVMTHLHAGGKFGGDDGAYTVSGGLHGVGVSVVNALSTRLEVDIARDGYIWHQSYTKAVPGSMRRGAASPQSGTTVRFWADPDVFETNTYDFAVIARRLQEMAFLNSELTITLRDDRDDESEPRSLRYNYPGGLRDFVSHLNSAKEPLHTDILSFTGYEDGLEIAVGMQWNHGYVQSVHTFANTISTAEGGTHEEGFRSALTSAVNKYARETGRIKGSDPSIGGDDIREGLAAIVSVKVAEPQFEGQTKTRLGNSAVRSFVHRVCYEKLIDWLESHPNESRSIIDKALSSAQARVAARKARELVRKKTAGQFLGAAGKLSDCRSSDPAISELYIVEGDSAGGSAKSGRDSMFQAVLPIRGKIINPEKARLDKVLKNTEVQSIISALGTGIRDDFDIQTLRYQKIILMADADVDGQHITTLLLTLLYRFAPRLIECGYVYLANPPLFKLKWQKSAPEFAYSDRERDTLLAAGTTAGKRINRDDGVQRYKGLGEMNASELWDTTMNPRTRTLKQMTVDDAAATDRLFAILMGQDVDARRGFIASNARDVRFLDI
ncbi:DNA topoisomerase (ATP-hydrolyzing) subunit B [Tsukamurella soli]|uniref:DNA gyrase subunit B n=1 Tax=Tsukamurella soli TaxID=644556 RepID=A0ABP8J9V7_9ACTN